MEEISFGEAIKRLWDNKKLRFEKNGSDWTLGFDYENRIVWRYSDGHEDVGVIQVDDIDARYTPVATEANNAK